MNQVLKSSNQLSCERIFHSHHNGQPLFTDQELSAFLKAACGAIQEKQSCSKKLSISLESVLGDIQSHRTLALPLSIPANQPDQFFPTVVQGLTKLYTPGEQYLKCRFDFLELIPEDLVNAKPKTRSWFSTKALLSKFSAFFSLWNHWMQDDSFFTRVHLR